MTLYALDGAAPTVPASGNYYIAPSAQVIGKVILAEEVGVWFNAVLRGDNEPITIGHGSNVQDGCVFHTDPGFPLIVGADVTVGHSAILHGCTIGDGTLIGMGAVILSGARIGDGALVAAGAVVREGMEVPAGSMVAGVPARIRGEVTAEHRERIAYGVENYVQYSRRYIDGDLGGGPYGG